MVEIDIGILRRGLLGLHLVQRSTDIDGASDENQDRSRLT
jgi:hypothetical protein